MLFRVVLLASICAFALSMYTADPAKWDRHQYLVKVLTKDVKIGNISTCSGSLLSPSVVLTSANCFPNEIKNVAAQAIIRKKDSSDMMNKAMLAVRIDDDLAVMKIDAVQDEHFCDKDPHPPRVARLNFKPSLTEATYQTVEPKDLQDSRCRVVGFTTNDDVEDFASSQEVQVLELDVRADQDNFMFSEVNANSTRRACWDDIGAPLECIINEETKWVQVGVLNKLYGRKMEEDTNSTMTVTCSDVQAMQFVVFGDNTFAHAIENVDKSSVFEAQDKCF
uniref:Peptidase S1 domain-containing protein n=1 Tax=Caenorhabditis tropicalis TaxID=1561998 RepID=A0A1I7TWE3_9PELO